MHIFAENKYCKNGGMGMERKVLQKKEFDFNIILIILSILSVFFIIWTFTGHWPWKPHGYNSYILQAQAWLDGRLDLGQNYEHLELAVFDGKYFVSFPPFPSYLMLPFVLIGWDTCDGFIALAASLSGAVYAYKTAKFTGVSKNTAVFFALFLTIGSNWLLTAQNAWVWFIAQNMAFALCMAAIYYAMKNKAGLSLALWACAVGCRPFQALYIPVLIYILYTAHKKNFPDDKIIDIIKKRFLAVVPMLIIAASYMILNYARFGNITEFGHNYLPEHTSSQYGQLNIVYVPENIKNLLRLPSINSDGTFDYPPYNGMCIFMVSPIFISYLVYTIKSYISKGIEDKKLMTVTLISIVLIIFCTTMHVTMGGSQFGNRYINDVLPLVLLGICPAIRQNSKYEKLNVPLFFIGFTLNLIGSVLYYLN